MCEVFQFQETMSSEDSIKSNPLGNINNKLIVARLMRDFGTNSNRITTHLILILILLLCVKCLEGRPGVIGLESGEVKGGNVMSSLRNGALTLPKTEHSKSNIKLAEQDDDMPNLQRYPISQIDFGHVKTPFTIGAWILSASFAKIAFHMTPKLHKYVPESCLLILVGVVVGVIMVFSTNFFVSPLTPNTFFLYLLPPIILDAGYFMPNRKFFDNLGTIILMAVVGTIFNIATIGVSLWLCGLTGIYGAENTPGILDIFLFASLIAAVDPVAVLAVFEEIKVNEVLYIVVFGESLLNDAVTVVMYHMMEAYDEIGVENIIAQDILSGVASFFVVALGGTIIGIVWGFLLGFVTRFTRHVLIIEPIFVFLMAYLSYLNAEMFHMSGILAITFCGITGKNYVESNISSKSQTTIKYALKMLSNSSETIIFMFLGVASVHSSHLWNTWFVILTIAFCSLFRTLGVILFSWLANRSRLHKLTSVDQFVMSYGGLRGAVAFALVLLIDERVVKQKDMFVTTTIAVIYFTAFLQGITIKPLVEILNVKRADKRELTMNERINERFIDHVMAGVEDIIGHNTGNYNLRDKFRRFNDRFIRPMLIRDSKSAERKIIQTYSKLTLQDAMAIMEKSASFAGRIPENASSNSLNRNYFMNLFANSADFRASLEEPYCKYFDIEEFDYCPTRRNVFDAEIHHLKTEQWRPYKNKPKNVETKSSKPNLKGNKRTHKIQIRRYVTNKKHRFLKEKSSKGSDSQQTQKNLVSFSDQPQHLRSDISEFQTDDDDEGLTIHIESKDEVDGGKKPVLKEEVHVAETHHFQFPWRDLYDKKKRSSVVSADTEKPVIVCDKAKSHVQETFGHKITNIPHIDSATSHLSSSSYKTMRNESITSDTLKTDDLYPSSNNISNATKTNEDEYSKNSA